MLITVKYALSTHFLGDLDSLEVLIVLSVLRYIHATASLLFEFVSTIAGPFVLCISIYMYQVLTSSS